MSPLEIEQACAAFGLEPPSRAGGTAPFLAHCARILHTVGDTTDVAEKAYVMKIKRTEGDHDAWTVAAVNCVKAHRAIRASIQAYYAFLDGRA